MASADPAGGVLRQEAWMREELATADSGAATRRSLLLGAGAAGATAVLAACGTDDADNGGSGSAGTGATTPPAADPTGAAGGTKIAAAADIPVGGGAVFASQGVVVTQPTEGTFKGYSSTCTHQGCPLASVDGGTINCSCHGSKFSIEDGSVKNGPASKPLDEKTVTKDGDNILLA
jgi:nitrite reductase/ring-hydroxylating ferredoxin subunit